MKTIPVVDILTKILVKGSLTMNPDITTPPDPEMSTLYVTTKTESVSSTLEPVCYAPVHRQSYKETGDNVPHWLDPEHLGPYLTDTQSEVTCKECLEYIHA